VRFLVAVIAISAIGLSLGVADDAGPPDADKVVKSYEKAIADARAALLKGFENAGNAIRNRTGEPGEKKLARVKDLDAEKAAFVDSGKHPDSSEMKNYLAEYKDAIGRAERGVQRDLDSVIDALTKKGELDKASALVTRKKAFGLEAENRKNKGEYASLLGRWDIEIPQVPFKSEWTISPDGNVAATEGGSLKGTWKHDKKYGIVIAGEGIKLLNWLAYPIKSDGTTTGGTTENRNYRVIATKIREPGR